MQTFKAPEGIALRYGLLYGGDGAQMRRMLQNEASRCLSAVCSGGFTISTRRGTVSALEVGRAGQAYNVWWTGIRLVCWLDLRGVGLLQSWRFNLANISEFFRSIPGPEDALAGHPLTLVTVILVQIVITMWAVWWGAAKVPTDVVSGRDENMSHAERVSGLGFVER